MSTPNTLNRILAGLAYVGLAGLASALTFVWVCGLLYAIAGVSPLSPWVCVPVGIVALFLGFAGAWEMIWGDPLKDSPPHRHPYKDPSP